MSDAIEEPRVFDVCHGQVRDYLGKLAAIWRRLWVQPPNGLCHAAERLFRFWSEIQYPGREPARFGEAKLERVEFGEAHM